MRPPHDAIAAPAAVLKERMFVFDPWSEGVATEGSGDVGPVSNVAFTNA